MMELGLAIEQTPEEMLLAFQVHSRAAIEAVRVSSATWQSRPADPSQDAPIKLEFHKSSEQAPGPPDHLRIDIHFRATGRNDGDEPGREVFSVDCTFEVDYSLQEGFEITPEQVEAFKGGNAIFNAWPYFREFLQNAVQRMGLPPLAAPFLRLQPKQAPEPAAEQQQPPVAKAKKPGRKQRA
jgi:hypothetical protein